MGIYINYKMISAGLRNMMARNIAVAQNGMFAAQAMPLRNSAKKGKKAKKDEAEATVTEEEEPAVEREAVAEPFTPSTRTCLTLLTSMRTLKTSECSPITRVLDRLKSNNLTLHSLRLPPSTPLPSDSWKSSLKTSVLTSSRKSPTSTEDTTLPSTRRRRSPLSLLRPSVVPRKARCLKLSRLTPPTPARHSPSSTRSTPPSSEASRCTPRVSSWTCPSPPASVPSRARSRRCATEDPRLRKVN